MRAVPSTSPAGVISSEAEVVVPEGMLVMGAQAAQLLHPSVAGPLAQASMPRPEAAAAAAAAARAPAPTSALALAASGEARACTGWVAKVAVAAQLVQTAQALPARQEAVRDHCLAQVLVGLPDCLASQARPEHVASCGGPASLFPPPVWLHRRQLLHCRQRRRRPQVSPAAHPPTTRCSASRWLTLAQPCG